MRSIILYLTRADSFSSVSLGGLLGGDVKCRATNTNVTSYPSAVLMDTLTTEKLQYIGGTGHWFHLIERVLPFIIPAAKTVWRRGAQLRPSLSKAEGGAETKLYIIFQDAVAPTNLDALGRLVLASILSGGFYDQVIIGHADDVGDKTWKAGTTSLSQIFEKGPHSSFTMIVR